MSDLLLIEFEVELHGAKPPTKGRHRTCRLPGGGFRQYPDPETARWEKVVQRAFQQARPDGFTVWPGPVRLEVYAYWPVPKSWPKWKRALALAGKLPHTGQGDGDNVLKLVADALEGRAYVNDHQVHDAHVVKLYSERPRLEVAVEFHAVQARRAERYAK